MTIIYLLIPLSLVLVVAAVGAFVWAVRAGQFDDMSTPAERIIFEDDARPPQSNSRGDEPGDDPRDD